METDPKVTIINKALLSPEDAFDQLCTIGGLAAGAYFGYKAAVKMAGNKIGLMIGGAIVGMIMGKFVAGIVFPLFEYIIELIIPDYNP